MAVVCLWFGRMGMCVQLLLQLPCLPVICRVLRRLVKCAQSMLQLSWSVSENYAEWRHVYIRCVCCSVARGTFTCPCRSHLVSGHYLHESLVYHRHLFAVQVLMRCFQRSAHLDEVR